MEIDLLADEPYRFDKNLELTVLFIVEEWNDECRRAEIHVTIKVKTPEIEDEITLTTENRKAAWHGYEFEYMGGWRKGVELDVRRTGKPVE